MKNLPDDEYESLKKFLGLFYDWYIAKPSHRPENHPLIVAKKIEGKSRSQARRGLEMAINDCIEDSSEWSPEAVALADRKFLLNNSPSLSEVRAKYSRKFLQLLKRGSIKSPQEYYLAKGIIDGGGVELGAGEAEKLAAMLTDYESRVHPRTEK